MPAINHEEGVSACLLVNDENPRLPEWIAYHYLTLPLRSLVVAVDPASRSSPDEILIQWFTEMGLDVRPWSEKRYLPNQMRGPCKSNDPEKCLWHHRDRQQYFIMKCMAEFKKLNKTWVLLTDVDEYLVYNRIRGDDPATPMDEAPEGIPTISNWKYHNEVGSVDGVNVGGVIDGTVNGKYLRTDLLDPRSEVAYGQVVEDLRHNKYFLRDDVAYLESNALEEAPPGVPTVKDPWFAKNLFYVRMYNDTYDNNEDGAFVQIKMDWEIGDEKRRSFYGGHLITDIRNRTYFVENEHRLWPPRYSAKDSLAARARLPFLGSGRTVLDVLKAEAREGYAHGALGPCLSVPRLLYGSREDENATNDTAPEGFDGRHFVTMRYRWHANKGEFEASKYGKTIIDVSRVPMEALSGKALNIHRPLTYYCRKDPVKYAISLFRVNHYLDSFEAYSYRNDARSHLRQCKECYEKKGSGAAVAMDDDIRLWLRKFVELVGREKAQRLLSKAGEFVKFE